MKRNVLVMAILATFGFSATMTAQETKMVPTDTITHIEFAPHWYVQANAGAAYTIGETRDADLFSPAAALNVGYQLSPVWGVRLGLSGWEGRGGFPQSTEFNYRYNYVQANLDATFSLSNLFGGFKHDRTWNWYALAGVGVNYAFNNGQAVSMAQHNTMQYLWNDHLLSVAGRAGAGVDYRLTENISLNFELNANVLTDRFNSKRADNADWQFNALVGVAFRLGKNHTKTDEIIYTAVKEEPAPVVVEEPAPVVEEPKVVVVEPMTQNIFFDLNKSVIREDQVSKVDELVAYLNKYPKAKVEITGYADKNTGNARINARLGEERSAAVAEALQARGIAADRIVTAGKGDTEQPFSVNDENRVSVCIAK